MIMTESQLDFAMKCHYRTVLLLPLMTLTYYGRAQDAQSYVVLNDKIEVVEVQDGDVLVDFTNLDTIKREHFINGSIKFIEDMDDEHFKFDVEMFTSPQGNGDYKKMAMDVPPTGVCEGFAKFYREFVQPSLSYDENTNIPHIGDDGLCPLPAGEYFFHQVLFNTDSWPNQMPRGTLKVIVKFYKDDVLVGGIIGYFKIEDDTR